MRCHPEGGREGAIAGFPPSTGAKLLISNQMPYLSRASLQAECQLPEIRTPCATGGDGERSRRAK